MVMILIDMVMMAHLREINPYSRQCTHTFPNHLMKDLALGLTWTTCGDDVHPPPPWKPSFDTPWTLGLFYDDVILEFDGDVGVFLLATWTPHNGLMWHRNYPTFLALWMMIHGFGRPSFTSRRIDVTTYVVYDLHFHLLLL
jgi:hypothetical protein